MDLLTNIPAAEARFMTTATGAVWKPPALPRCPLSFQAVIRRNPYPFAARAGKVAGKHQAGSAEKDTPRHQTPLHYAADKVDEDTIRALLEGNPDLELLDIGLSTPKKWAERTLEELSVDDTVAREIRTAVIRLLKARSSLRPGCPTS
ncbi:hypothetical protein B0H63DRAFT_560149 [Podospora didyma]|uniref:Uncharacterized protein n=1 Tax=Podospora didyma TaxID=330526 RepID=A0AAE0NQ87_9PEZI|nr:hypothetical protein B0H63DRAFT_560149 [Podospora didyma]